MPKPNPKEAKSARATTSVNFETVRKIGLELPGIEQSTTHGSPALKLKGRLVAWIPVKKEVEPNTLAVRLDFAQRDALIREAPDVYYLTNHYLDYPSVLVRLSRIDAVALRDLIRAGWSFVSRQSG
jgi:hypothetical protein